MVIVFFIFLSRSMSRLDHAIRPIISLVLKVCCLLHYVHCENMGHIRVKNIESFEIGSADPRGFLKRFQEVCRKMVNSLIS